MRRTVLLLFCFFALANVHAFMTIAPAFQEQNTENDSLLKVAKSNYVYDDPSKAIKIGKEVLRAAKDKHLQFKALTLISTAYYSERDYKKAVGYALKAKKIAEDLDEVYLKILIYTKLGELYHQLKVYDKSIRSLDKAEKLCLSQKENPTKYSFQLASNYIIKGFIYKDRLSCDIAISFFNKGIKEYQKSTNPNKNNNISIAEYNKGNCYSMSLNYKAAITSYQKAIKAAKKLSANSLQAFAEKGLAEVYTLQGHYKRAIDLLKHARKISINVGDLVLNREIYKGLSENYLALDERENYKEYNTLYLDYRLKVKTAERKSINTSLNRIIQENNKEIQESKNRFSLFLKILISASIIFILATVFLIRKQKKTISTLQKKVKSLQKPKN